MLRLITCAVPVILLLAPTVTHACMPPSIEFGFGSARLGPNGREEVDYVANEFRGARSEARVRLIAQTDGSDANVRMSRRRAEAVKAALVRAGVPARAIIVETRNESSAVISGEGYARRVVMEVVPATPTGAGNQAGSC